MYFVLLLPKIKYTNNPASSSVTFTRAWRVLVRRTSAVH